MLEILKGVKGGVAFTKEKNGFRKQEHVNTKQANKQEHKYIS